jgi:hypothetical protein
MKNWSLLFLLMACALFGRAQICIGNSTQATAAMFDPNWIYGCATGTSCSGGVQFTNLAACEPVTAMDACAPAPTSCGSATNGSDLWFMFYAMSTTATINVIQNTSYVVAVQAFSGPNDCASLVQIGCNVAGGPSSGVQLVLNSLNPGELYFFRVYGSANNASQRTGNYCFCGSAGLSNTPLAAGLHLTATAETTTAMLEWTVADGAGIDHFEIERGATIAELQSIATIPANSQAASATYDWNDRNASGGVSYYRIKAMDQNGAPQYSNVAEVNVATNSNFELVGNLAHDVLTVRCGNRFAGNVLNLQGAVVAAQSFAPGDNTLNVQHLPAGLYFFQNVDDGAICRFAVQH